MPLVISEDLAARIRLRMAEVSSLKDSTTAALAQRLQALPLRGDMGGLYALRLSGEVVSIDWMAIKSW